MDGKQRDRTRQNSALEERFFEPIDLTPEEKRAQNKTLETIGERICETCGERDLLTNFPTTKHGRRVSYRYVCRKCHSTARAEEMREKYKNDPVYRAERIKAAQDYRDSLTNKKRYNEEGKRRSRLSRLRRGLKHD